MKPSSCSLAVLLAALAAATPAAACRSAEYGRPFLHETLPEVPERAFAAEVEIPTDLRASADGRIEVRVLNVLAGDPGGSRLLVAAGRRTSCDRPPRAGSTGILVGRVTATADGIPRVDPIRAPSRRQRERAEAAGRPIPSSR